MLLIQYLAPAEFDYSVAVAALTADEIRDKAQVPQPTIRAELHGSLFSCETPRKQPLSLCLWKRDETIVMNQQRGHEGQIIVPAISCLNSYGLWYGECGLRIESLSHADFKRRWTCVLVAQDATIYALSVGISKFHVYVNDSDTLLR